jgi:hypothetical protein
MIRQTDHQQAAPENQGRLLQVPHRRLITVLSLMLRTTEVLQTNRSADPR